MNDQHIDDERSAMGRRTFLTRSASAAGIGLGLGSLQDQEKQVQRKMALERVARFEKAVPSEDYVGRIALVTADAEPREPPADLTECGFLDWAPDGFTRYQVLVIEKASRIARGINFEARRVDLDTASVIAEKHGYVAASSDDIPPGTPYIINGQEDCPGSYVGVTLERVPGRFVGPVGQSG